MAQVPPSNFIAATSLEEYFVDNNTGLPLANGAVYFYQDISRTTPKLVYELIGDPTSVGGYSFAALPDPVRLSAAGTFMDNNGNNIAVYYNPYDSSGNLDLYYVVVTDQYNNVEFTRSAWPPIAIDITPGDLGEAIYENQISNSQFVDISFSTNANATQVYTFAAAGTYNIQIGADWFLSVSPAGASSVTVTRTAIAGGPPIATNPPYTLTITPGANIPVNSIFLRQRLFSNPGIWSQTGATGANGYISASILLAPASHVTISYAPSTGPVTTILDETNTSIVSAAFNNTVQLPISTNPSAPTAGYADIYIYVGNASATTFSSVQVVGLTSNQGIVPYIQQTVNRQQDNLFHWYKPRLDYKPIPSYLVGWDFPLNPTSITGLTGGTLSNAALTSQYVWDQTIVWTQLAGSNFAYSRTGAGSFNLALSGGNPSQFALIQYLDVSAAEAILSQNLSVNIAGTTTQIGGISGVVSLWYTSGTALPNVATGTGQSIVSALNVDGSVAAFNQPTPGGNNWIQVPRNLVGNISGAFSITSNTPGVNSNSPLTGWGLDTTGTASTVATFFAIVVGFAPLASGSSVAINSISLVPGQVPTIPAPQKQDEVIRECQRYFWRTYSSGIPTGTANASGNLTSVAVTLPGAVISTGSFLLRYPVTARTIPVITLYSATSGTMSTVDLILGSGAAIWVTTVAAPNVTIANWIPTIATSSAFYRQTTAVIVVIASNYVEAYLSYHVVLDARLGIV